MVVMFPMELPMMSGRGKSVWITWERQRRSLVMAEHFGARLFMYDKSFSTRWTRYLFSTYHTTMFLLREKPDVVFGQNPSMILALLLCMLRPLFRYVLVIDRHSNFMLGVKGRILSKRLFHLISNTTIKWADMTIVTNRFLKELVDTTGGNGIVLQDKLPPLAPSTRVSLPGKWNIVYVTSFSSDEPIDEVLEAFENMDQSIKLFVTGNYRRHPKYVSYCSRLPANIVFTGYLSEEDYVSTLHAADIVMCLTKNDYTLTCGAYEGLSLGKPMILSNTNTIRDYFSKGVMYADPDSDSIRDSMLHCLASYDILKSEVAELKSIVETNWSACFTDVINQIECRLRV